MVTFPSIFPACYSGRRPHIHFEVYPSFAKATDSANKIATSQIALPKNTCDAVYATHGYSQSVSNLAQVGLQSDMVFGNDAGVHQIGKVTGSWTRATRSSWRCRCGPPQRRPARRAARAS